MLNAPHWVAAATFDDLAAAYPAKGGGVEGYAAAHCGVERTGALAGCEIIQEQPRGRDFGRAALKLALKFRLDPATVAQAPKGAPLFVNVPIRRAAAG